MKYVKPIKRTGEPRETARGVSNEKWEKLQKTVYNKIDKYGYSYVDGGHFGIGGRYRSMRDIFNIPRHIPNEQIKAWIKEFRERGLV